MTDELEKFGIKAVHDLAGWCIRDEEGFYWTGSGALFDDDPWHACYFDTKERAEQFLPEIQKEAHR